MSRGPSIPPAAVPTPPSLPDPSPPAPIPASRRVKSFQGRRALQECTDDTQLPICTQRSSAPAPPSARQDDSPPSPAPTSSVTSPPTPAHPSPPTPATPISSLPSLHPPRESTHVERLNGVKLVPGGLLRRSTVVHFTLEVGRERVVELLVGWGRHLEEVSGLAEDRREERGDGRCMVAKPSPVTKVMSPMALATGMRPDISERRSGGGKGAANAKARSCLRRRRARAEVELFPSSLDVLVTLFIDV